LIVLNFQGDREVVKADKAQIAIGPTLIRAGQRLRMTIITAGRPSVTCPNPSLAGVTVREQTSPQLDRRLFWAGYFAFMGGAFITWGIGSVILLPYHGSHGTGVLLIVIGAIGVYSYLGIASTVGISPRRRKT
jgi:hypothetical protein